MFGKPHIRLPHATLCRKLSSSNCSNQSIKNVVVIGGGLMGSGIAQVYIALLHLISHLTSGYLHVLGSSTKWSKCDHSGFGS